MSNARIPSGGVSESGKESLLHIKDAPLFKELPLILGWIAGLVFVAGLCWFLTQPLRTRRLMSAVNLALEQAGDSRRLGTFVSSTISEKGFSGMGTWYTMTGAPGKEQIPGGTRVLIFPLVAGGTFFPCAAVAAPGGKVEQLIPLGVHGARMMQRVSPGIIKIYTARIEGEE